MNEYYSLIAYCSLFSRCVVQTSLMSLMARALPPNLLHQPLSQLVLSIPSRYLCPNRVTSFFGNNFINFSKCVVTKQDMYMHQSSSQITKIRFLLHNKIAASQIYKFQYVIHTGERHFFINGKLRFDDKLS